MSTQILIDSYDGNRNKQKLTYFLENGGVYKLEKVNVMNKTWKESKYILYLLEVKNEATQKWSEFIKKTLIDKKKFMMKNSSGIYILKYISDEDKEVEMEKNSVRLQIVLGTKHLIFNEESKRPGLIKLRDSMVGNNIYDLRLPFIKHKKMTQC